MPTKLERCARQTRTSKFFSALCAPDTRAKRLTPSSVAKFCSALRAPGLQKQLSSALRAPDTRENESPSLALQQKFLALRAPRLQKQKFLRAAHARYKRKRVTMFSVVKIVFALPAQRLQKQNVLRAARARYQRKCVTRFNVAQFLSALRAPGLQKQNVSPRCLNVHLLACSLVRLFACSLSSPRQAEKTSYRPARCHKCHVTTDAMSIMSVDVHVINYTSFFPKYSRAPPFMITPFIISENNGLGSMPV